VPCLSQATILFLAAVVPVAVSGSRAVPRVVVLRQGLSHVDRAAAVSSDGRFVAFVSSARLTSADLNEFEDVYVFDPQARTVSLETAAVEGGASNGRSGNPGLSGDGRYLVFESDATNLTSAPDTNRSMDVFLRDRHEASTRRISIGASRQEANGPSANPVISADARVVAFVSRATNLVAGADANGARTDIYLAALETDVVARVSVGSDGRQPDQGNSFAPALSADGGVVAFTSSARFDDAIAQAPGVFPAAVFAREVSSGMTICVSCTYGGRAFDPDVTADGRFVVFTLETDNASSRRRTDLVLMDRNSLVASVLTRRGNGSSSWPKISANGRFVVFQSQASNLECERRCLPGRADENLLHDIYVFDRERKAFMRVSGDQQVWWAPSIAPHIDAKGDVIVFSSRQSMVPEDLTSDFDLFVLRPIWKHLHAE
jgi:Tol biopolymer transport system component